MDGRKTSISFPADDRGWGLRRRGSLPYALPEGLQRAADGISLARWFPKESGAAEEDASKLAGIAVVVRTVTQARIARSTTCGVGCLWGFHTGTSILVDLTFLLSCSALFCGSSVISCISNCASPHMPFQGQLSRYAARSGLASPVSRRRRVYTSSHRLAAAAGLNACDALDGLAMKPPLHHWMAIVLPGCRQYRTWLRGQPW